MHLICAPYPVVSCVIYSSTVVLYIGIMKVKVALKQ